MFMYHTGAFIQNKVSITRSLTATLHHDDDDDDDNDNDSNNNDAINKIILCKNVLPVWMI
jgi:hypothetical protein